MQKGKLAIEFAITKDGTVTGMKMAASSGSMALDLAAWGAILASNSFPPLPSEFTGPSLALRFLFYYNPEKSDLVPSGPPLDVSGVSVSIPSLNNPHVPVGGVQLFSATVPGAKDNSVEWNVSGAGCSGAGCGKMVGSLYIAPIGLPDPADVTVTAISKANPNAKASVTIHIVPRAESC
jgi:TonB family protein